MWFLRKRYTQLRIASTIGMDVAVGSTNPVKRVAVHRALDRFEPTVRAVRVDPGVPPQPRSLEETIDGAETRASRAFETAGFEKRRRGESIVSSSVGVGIEGGVARLDSTPGLYLIMWAAVTDGVRMERGGGPSLRLPDWVASRLDDGAELGPVIDDFLGTENVAENEGAAGVLTVGLTDRTSALETAVSCAVGPFLSSHYEH